MRREEGAGGPIPGWGVEMGREEAIERARKKRARRVRVKSGQERERSARAHDTHPSPKTNASAFSPILSLPDVRQVHVAHQLGTDDVQE